MKPSRIVLQLVLLVFSVVICGVTSSAALYSYGNPTPAEQAHLEAINRARMNPQAEAIRLGIDLFEGVSSGDISGSPVQPLTFNAQLYQAALLHSTDMIARDYFSHYTPPDNVSPFTRIIAAGYNYWTAGENLAISYATYPLGEVATIIGMHDGLFIDAGVTGRGHRVNILYEDFQEVGIGAASGSYKTYPYAWALTCDFGSSTQEPNPFLLGVVYDDLNGDAFYNAGEGIEGVRISLPANGSQTYTAFAGGYGMPVPSGAYTVRAMLPDGRTTERQINIGQQNVKIDFLLSEFTGEPKVVIASGNFDLDTAEEFVVATTQAGVSVLLSFYDDNGDLLNEAYAGAVSEISLASGNFDSDPEEEVVMACVQGDGTLAAIIFDSDGTRLSKGVGGQCSGIAVAAGQFDADGLDEYVVTLLQADGRLAAISFNHDGTRLGKGVGGTCSNLSVAAGNFDSNPADEEYVVALLQSDGTLAAITFQGDGTRIGKGTGGLCSNVDVAAGNFMDGNGRDEYVVSLLQNDGTLATITFQAGGARIGKGVGGICGDVSIASGRFADTEPLDGYVVSLTQADSKAAAIFFRADGIRIGKGVTDERVLSTAIGTGDFDTCGTDEAVLAYLNESAQKYWTVFKENGQAVMVGP